MPPENPISKSPSTVIQSGPEVVAKFIEEMRADSSPDKPTIEVIATLFEDN